MKKLSKIYLLSDKEFLEIVNRSRNTFELFNNVGFIGNPAGRSLTYINNRLKKLGVYKDFKLKSNIYNNKNKSKYKIKDIFIKNSTYMNRTTLKKKLIEDLNFEYRCDVCNNDGSWMGKPITLQLDHINGINNDHRIENLRFICPNCHSQTHNYSGKKTRGTTKIKYTYITKKKKCIDCGVDISRNATRCKPCNDASITKRPDKDELLKVMHDNNFNFSAVGRVFNVSGTTVNKWCRYYKIENI